MKRIAVIAAVVLAWLGVACTPEQVAAVRAELYRRALVHQHPTLRCIRSVESDTAGGYLAQNPASSASGAYQFLDSTWRNVAPAAGVPWFSRAIHADPWLQDHVALWAVNNPQVAGRPWAGGPCQ